MADEATSRATGHVLAERLADAVRRAGWAPSGLVVLLGDPAVTGPAWDAVLDPVPGEWRRTWRPRDAADLLGGLRAASPPGPWTVVRVDDLRRVLLPDDDRLGVEVASTLRGLLRRPDVPVLLAASMPPDAESWRRLTQAPASGGHDRFAQARELLRDAVILTAGPVGTASPTVWRGPSMRPGPSTRPVPGSPVPAGPSPEAPQALPAAAVRAAEPDRWWEHLPPPAVRRSPVEPGPTSGAGPAPAAGPGPVDVPEPDDEPEPVVPPAGDDRPPAGEPPAVSEEQDAGEQDAGEQDAGEPDAGEQGPAEEQDRVAGAAGVVPGPGGTQESAREGVVTMSEAVARLAFPRWRPTALPPGEEGRVAPEELRRQGLAEERAGNLAGAVRLYERAAQDGDLVALGLLAALRSGASPDEAAEQMFRQAAQERNTAVLLGLAAAGHPGALALLARLRDEANGHPPE